MADSEVILDVHNLRVQFDTIEGATQAVRGVSGMREAPSLIGLMSRIAPRPVLLIAGGCGKETTPNDEVRATVEAATCRFGRVAVVAARPVPRSRST